MKKEFSVTIRYPAEMKWEADEMAAIIRMYGLEFFDVVEITHVSTTVNECPGCHVEIGKQHTLECPINGTGVA